jgi:sulfite reductase (ferredoxin)
MGLALPEDNCVDVYSQDLGLLTIHENGAVVGYNLLVGGGSGMTHGNANTFPFLAKPMAYVPADELLPAAEAVVKIFRDHGNRADRKRARIKYLVHDWGVERFRATLAEYFGRPLAPPKPIAVTGYDLHLGWHPQGDGKWFYGVSIESGRIKDDGTLRLRTGLRAIVQRFRPAIRLTAAQDLLLCDLNGGDLGTIESLLAEHGIPRPETVSPTQRFSLACPAIPTCGLAISEAERALPSLVQQVDGVLRELGLEQEVVSVRMTGCPNGCVRPYQSDIGVVGRSGDKYTLFVGGSILGHRLNFELLDLVPRDQIAAALRPLLVRYRESRQPAEAFGDWCARIGADAVRAICGRTETPKH